MNPSRWRRSPCAGTSSRVPGRLLFVCTGALITAVACSSQPGDTAEEASAVEAASTSDTDRTDAADDADGADDADDTPATQQAPRTSASTSPQAPPSGSETTRPSSRDSAESEPGFASAEAVQSALDTIEVKGRAPKTGYSRDEFGPAWTDNVTVPGGGNGCDTRNDILQRDLTDLTFAPDDDCIVLTGVLDDPYTGQLIDFQRGQDTSTEVQIDHVVALSDAWQKGAQQLSEDERRNLANDPLNLLAVDGPANQQKGDGDAASWLPSNKEFRCEYVARQTFVKAEYDLWVTQAERDAILRNSQACDDGAPAGAIGGDEADGADRGGPAERDGPADSDVDPDDAPVGPAAAQFGDDVYFENCDAARAAGAAPILAGEPGYRPALDGDSDGVACE